VVDSCGWERGGRIVRSSALDVKVFRKSLRKSSRRVSLYMRFCCCRKADDVVAIRFFLR